MPLLEENATKLKLREEMTDFDNKPEPQIFVDLCQPTPTKSRLWHGKSSGVTQKKSSKELPRRKQSNNAVAKVSTGGSKSGKIFDRKRQSAVIDFKL